MVLGDGVTADPRLLLPIKLVTVTTPKRDKVTWEPSVANPQTYLSRWRTHLHPEACWLSDNGAPTGESVRTPACPGLWMEMPGICCHVEGMRICWVPAGQPCCMKANKQKQIKPLKEDESFLKSPLHFCFLAESKKIWQELPIIF